MRRLVRCSLLAMLLMHSLATGALAQIPSGPNSTIPPCISLVASTGGVPDPFGMFTIVVRDNFNNPISAANVEIDFSGCPDLSPASVQYLSQSVDCNLRRVSGVTDINGAVTFNITGAAINQLGVGLPPCATIFANSTQIGTARVSAFDLDGFNGVDLNDLSLFLADFASGINFQRSDYDCSGSIGANDLSRWLCNYASGNGKFSEPLCAGGGVSTTITSGQVNLAWNECALTGTPSNRTFGCNTNAGSEQLVVSVIPGQTASQVSAFEVLIDFKSAAGTTLPAWWRFETLSSCGSGGSTGCRAGSLSASTNFSSLSDCADPGLEGFTVTATATYSPGSPNEGHLRITGASATPVELSAGTEFYLARVLLNHAKTVGATACAGCAEPVCMSVRSVRLIQPTALPHYLMTASGIQNLVTWQGTPVGCSFTPACPSPGVPASADMVAWWGLDELVSGETLPVPDLVHPSSMKNWGTLLSGASLVPGLVGDALRCEAATDGVQVPHSVTSGLNFTNTESFGIDAWVYPRSGAPAGARRVIVDKQGNGNGYTFYVRDGMLGLEVHPGVFETAAQVTDDAWHLVAVTVDRSASPAQSHVKFYLDGVEIHSVDAPYFSATSTPDLYIGRMGASPVDAFHGDIDELEMWSPPPSPSTIQGLWAAGCAGKRKEYVRLPRNITGRNGIAQVCAVVCNMTSADQTYNWSVGLGLGCTGLGFSPASGSLTVARGMCDVIPFEIQGSPGLKSCYQVAVVNVADTEHPLTAVGSVLLPGRKVSVNSTCSPQAIEPIGLTAGSAVLSAGGQVAFTVHNDSTSAVTLNYTLIPWDEGAGTASQRVGLNGLPPGTPVTGTVLVPAADSAGVSVAAEVGRSQVFLRESVMLLGHLQGDAQTDSLATALIRFPEDTTSSVVGVRGDQGLTNSTHLFATPNPFLALTTVAFSLAGPQDVEAGVYDVAGRQVRLLHRGRLGAGIHRLEWNGLDMNGQRSRNGIYFIRMERGGERLRTKVILLR